MVIIFLVLVLVLFNYVIILLKIFVTQYVHEIHFVVSIKYYLNYYVNLFHCAFLI